MIRIAFYRGHTRLFNRLVSWWLRGGYSHCELMVERMSDGRWLCASSSYQDGGVRLKSIDLAPDRWAVVSVPGDLEQALRWFEARIGAGYDVPGLLGFVWRRARQDQRRWFCSEAVAAAIGYREPWRFDPCTLYAAAMRDAAINDASRSAR